MARRRDPRRGLSLEEVAALAEARYPSPEHAGEGADYWDEELRLGSLRTALVREHGYTPLEYLRLRVGPRGFGGAGKRRLPNTEPQETP